MCASSSLLNLGLILSNILTYDIRTLVILKYFFFQIFNTIHSNDNGFTKISKKAIHLTSPSLFYLKTVENFINFTCALEDTTYDKDQKFGQFNVPVAKQKTCNLSNLKIHELESYLETLDDIKELNLSNNNIKSLPANLFWNWNKLTRLNLSNNQIEEIDLETFSRVPNLEYLDLSNNKIKNLDTVLKDLSSLKYIKLDHNQITNLTTDSFLQNSKLEVITLGYNRVESIEIWSFEMQKNLIELHLNQNCIKKLEDETWLGLSSLTRLDLSKNRIDLIDLSTFDHTPKLVNLNLSENYLSKILPDLFSTPELKYLNLKSNLIAKLDSNSFVHLKSIRSIDLSYNLIQFIHMQNFHKLTTLYELNLSSNLIAFIQKKSFQDLQSLIRLNLNGNMLKNFDLDSFKDSVLIILDNNKIEPDLLSKLIKDSEDKKTILSLRISQSNENKILDKEWSNNLNEMTQKKTDRSLLIKELKIELNESPKISDLKEINNEVVEDYRQVKHVHDTLVLEGNTNKVVPSVVLSPDNLLNKRIECDRYDNDLSRDPREIIGTNDLTDLKSEIVKSTGTKKVDFLEENDPFKSDTSKRRGLFKRFRDLFGFCSTKI